MLVCSKWMIRLGSKVTRWERLCISLYMVSKHWDCGIEGYRPVTSMVTRIALSGTCRSCRVRESAVELCK